MKTLNLKGKYYKSNKMKKIKKSTLEEIQEEKTRDLRAF